MRFVKMNKFKLGGLLDATRGASLSGEHYATSGRLKRLTLANFDYANNGFKEDTSKDNLFYDGDVAEKFILRKGDIITPLTEQTPGLLGTTAMIPESGTYIQSQDVCLLKPFPDQLDAKFAYYLVSSKCVKEQLAARSQQTKIRHSSPDKIKDCTVFVPDLPIQERIGRLLFSIDTKIALNRKKIEKLEALAKTIYDYWFVQFDFPDANGRPYKSSGGKMVYNPILKREIPDGWEVGGIEDVCSVVDCLHTKKPSYQYECDDLFLLTLENLTKSGYVDLGTKFYISRDDYNEWTKNIEIKENDFVITNAGRAGDIVRVPKGVKCAAGRNMTVVRPLTIDPYYLAGFFKSPMMKQQLVNGLEEGSFFLNFNVCTIKRLKVLLPQDDAVRGILPIFGYIIKAIDIKRDEISKLIQYRDFLLPLLMNGQVEVGE